MIPVLPDEILDFLDDATPACDAASDAEVDAFLAKHTAASRPEILAGWVKALGNHFAAHASRHGSTVSVLAGALKEARAGYFSAQDAVDTLAQMFIEEVAKPPASADQNAARHGKEAEDEFDGILAWAVGQANAADLDEVRRRVDAQMPGNVQVVDAAQFANNSQATGNSQTGTGGNSQAGNSQATTGTGGTGKAKTAARKAAKRSIATQLVDMARNEYTLGVSDDGTPYGTQPSRPHIALPLRGGKLGLRVELARRYFDDHRVVPSSQALANACTVLEGYAAKETARPLHLRVAGHDGKVYIDTADAKDRVIEIGGGTWTFAKGAIPVMFRRTEPTAPMPDPVRGGELAKLWRFVRIAKEDRPILLAVLVAALIQPDVPHVILAFLAEHGCAKSSSARHVVSLIDPSVAPLRMPPRDIDGWVTTANGSYVVALDNLSSIVDWLSDALCRAATGEGHTKRQLYTDADLTVLRFRRVIILNGIDLGGLNGDLTDRLAPVDLERITDGDRKDETMLAGAWEQARPGILGGLLDLAAQVHAKLPTFTMSQMPRMADFARVLACVDDIRGTKGLEQYQKRAKHLAADGVAADPFIARMMESRFNCTDAAAADILAWIRPNCFPMPPDWPRKARTVTTRLSRAAPALRSLGWTIDNDNGQNKANATHWTIEPPP